MSYYRSLLYRSFWAFFDPLRTNSKFYSVALPHHAILVGEDAPEPRNSASANLQRKIQLSRCFMLSYLLIFIR